VLSQRYRDDWEWRDELLAEAQQRLASWGAWASRGSSTGTDVVGWPQDLVADADGHWHSNWLRACAVHAAKGRGVLDRVDVDAARALGDPIIDEVLSSASTGNGRERTARPAHAG